MSLQDIILLLAAVAAGAGALSPLFLSVSKSIKEIAAWRASVDLKLDAIVSASKHADKALGRSLDAIPPRLETLDARLHENSNAVRDLAGVAGRALGRTERGE